MQVALIGAGQWGQNLAANLYALDALFAVAEPSPALRQRMASLYPGVTLLEDHRPADPGVEDPVGHLAGAEARDADLPAELLVDLTEGVVQVAPRHLDRHPDPRGAEFLDGALHSGSAP